MTPAGRLFVAAISAATVSRLCPPWIKAIISADALRFDDDGARPSIASSNASR